MKKKIKVKKKTKASPKSKLQLIDFSHLSFYKARTHTQFSHFKLLLLFYNSTVVALISFKMKPTVSIVSVCLFSTIKVYSESLVSREFMSNLTSQVDTQSVWLSCL